MSTLYLTQHGTEVSKDGGKLIIKRPDDIVQAIPSTYAECVVILANVNITCGAIKEILNNKGSIIYLDSNGDIIGEIGRNNLNKRQLLRQVQSYMDTEKRLEIARSFVEKKIIAQRDLLNIKNKTLKLTEIKYAASKLNALAKVAIRQKSIDKLLGVEGLAAKTYFETFSLLIRDDDFDWNGRKRRPASDPVNSMLSFVYSLLEKDVRRAVSVAGLENSIGFLHAVDFRKDSLVYDIMEIFRPSIADKFVFRCLNWSIFKPSDFEMNGDGCFLKEEARNRFIKEYEEYMGEYIDDGEETWRGTIAKEVSALKLLLRNYAKNKE